MDRIQMWWHGRWTVPVVSGLLIIASFAVTEILDEGFWGDVLMIAATVVAGTPVVIKAVSALMIKVIGIDLLVSVAAIGAVLVQNYWEAAAVTFLFAIGHSLESATLNKTRSALAELVAVAPDVAIVVRGDQQIEIPAEEVAQGETVLVKNGARVPVDGVVTGGTGALDEASITGESIPVEKMTGDTVFAGTISTGGFMQVKATGVGADTTLVRIIHRVEEAQEAKAKTQQFMDRFSKWYTPGIMVLSVVFGLLTQDIVLALTLLVIGCPGALVISIPVAIVAGIGRGARDGILIKGGEYLETSAKIDAVALDKTGTLTEGRPYLTDVVAFLSHIDEDEVLRMAARAEAGSEHPLARPIIEAAAERGLPVLGLPQHTEPVPGKGIVASLDGHRVAVGNMALMEMEGVADHGEAANAAQAAEELAAAGRTPMIVGCDGRIIGVLGVADRIRTDAPAMIAQLHEAGVKKVIMLTGDTQLVAEAVAKQVGVDEVRASLLPEDKLNAVADLQRQGHTVAMVGDGVNDAPALATADIGVAMGAAGTGVAIETADIALMKDDLLKLPQAVRLARRTVNNMRQNIVIALTTVGLLLLGVLFGGVTMAIGMLVHEISVLVVIANAMRLLRRHGNDRAAKTTETPRPSEQPVAAQRA
ncbi:heavy metal translocating P-type ATPase [Nesterenkonia alkaliphila]|uniref:Heavy metal translocating P-type ATPase n=1 Tax=Nesterenkonia alkaliphila TaxID=1463631 RepID=A0A7K1UKQ4_9MICC|nr:cation-translocating P-type ATPase [Nesterenkonia alkaliphila]MVT27068.1 heavy metal translocating P-type ATPase [Nesterenkonia alkaliphila]GFZ99778.1 haloacid dehalogenase [Nesterenkonia alkaliphila]